MKPWWEAHPGRLEREEDALRADGIRVERDPEAFARGVIRLILTLPPDRWLTTDLIAVYPDSFPYTRPEILAPSLTLSHHQNPVIKNLCLLPRGSEHWPPTWTVARLLREQLPKLTRALELTDKTELAKVEIEQGEPLAYYFEYENDSAIFIDSCVPLPSGASGFFAVVPVDGNIRPTRGRLAVLADHSGRVTWSTAKDSDDDRAYTGIWFRLADRPRRLDDAAAMFAELEREHKILAKAPWKRGIQIVAIVFPDELGHRAEGVGWVFIVRRRADGKGGKARARASFVRAERYGPDDMASRLPEFRHLQQCGIAVFGLGCIGAPSALDFARSGIGALHLMDYDLVEAGTTVRWPFGLSAAGRTKVYALCEAISRDYPWVRSLRGHPTRLGLPDQKDPERESIEQMLTGVDLVYDATGEPGLQYFLSTVARERQLPYISVSGTVGARGGVVARLNHRSDAGCWWCFESAMDHTIPSPHADEVGRIQPVGCGQVTYIGANFDMMEIALQGVRLTIATLLVRRGIVAHDYGWDVGVVNLTDEAGRRIEPRWSVYTLDRHPDCPTCHQK